MSNELIPIPIVSEGFEERWAAWQARGDARDLATRQRLFLLALTLILSGAVLTGLWGL